MTRVSNARSGAGSSASSPAGVPHDGSAPHVRTAAIEVHADGPVEDLVPIWASIGYDEINWTYTPTGKRLLGTFGTMSETPFHVRPHYVFVSGNGLSLPHWGSGNVYHEGPDGTPFYDFTVVDETYDAIVGAGHHLIVELGFTPLDLVPDRAFREFSIIDSPTVYSPYEAGQWSYPPKDYAKWAALVSALAQHSLARYGADEVASWLWELWNEPDIFYWRGSREEFFELYDVTASAIRRVLPDAKVGGPAVTGGPDGAPFLREFLEHCAANGTPLDFVSFHTKGSQFSPWRTYGPIGASAPTKQSPSSDKMIREIRALLGVLSEFPAFVGLPVFVDECDAGVPAHHGFYDNANFGFQNTEYYPAFQVKLMKKLLDVNAVEQATIQRATSWSFYFEGERYFEGTRAFLTAGGVEKPFLNAYRALARLGAQRIPATSTAARPITEPGDRREDDGREEIDALASISGDGTVAVLVYRHGDDQYHRDDLAAQVSLTVTGLPRSKYRVQHFRIDEQHSNSYSMWKSLGSPADPSNDQLELIRTQQGLEEYEVEHEAPLHSGRVEMQLDLPLPSVSLLLLAPHE